MNTHTDEGVGFILCEIKLYKIGDSDIAPYFEVLERPNDWAKEMRQSKKSITRAKLPRIMDMIKWGVLKEGDLITSDYGNEDVTLLSNGHIRTIDGEESTLQQWLRDQTGWTAVETYKYSIHKETGKTLSELRKGYMEGGAS